MSTRALYTFIGTMRSAYVDRLTGKRVAAKRDHSWNVYKHSDGYPMGAADAIAAALPYAWQLPRYEADELACAFIAANKSYWIGRELELLRELETTGPKAVRNTHKGPRNSIEAIKEELAHTREYAATSSGGHVRLMPQGKPLAVANAECTDIAYRYEISLPAKGRELIVKAFAIGGEWGALTEELLFCGELKAFAEWAKREDEKERAA